MTDPETPLAVRVAEALGWTETLEHTQAEYDGMEDGPRGRYCGWRVGEWSGIEPGATHRRRLPDYPNDRVALWGLMLKYKISVAWEAFNQQWEAVKRPPMQPRIVWASHSTSPGIALCELIVELGKEGKL